MIQVEGIFAGVGGNELIVTAPTGSTVTVTKGSVTKTAIEKDGTWAFKGLEAGNWTVTATNGSKSNSVVVTIGETVEIVFGPTASLTAQSGVSYTNGLNGLEADAVSLFSAAISNNSDITNATSVVYIDHGEEHYKITVGDQVTLTFNGNNRAFDVIGFNHDTLTDATAYGKETATGKAGITFQAHDIIRTANMNNTSGGSNAGGWKNSSMRTSTMVTALSDLPDDWEAIIKPVNKVSGVGGTSSSWSGIETVSDSCFLLAEIEIFGTVKNSVSGEGVQYAYYKAGNSKIKKFYGGDAKYWWQRSPAKGDNSSFCLTSNTGGSTVVSSNNGQGVAFGFCV